MASSCQQTDLTKGMNRLRLDGKYSDVTIKCGDRSFFCHRVVLAAMSEFFECMFDSEMQESQTGEVDLSSLNVCNEVNICEKVLEFMYTGESAVDMPSAAHLLDNAQLMQIPSLQTACLKFLTTNLNKTNCLSVWQTAAAHGFAELDALALSLVKKHFQEVCFSDDFLALYKIDYILNILNGQNVNCPDTTVICKAVMSWIQADFENRSDYIEKIMRALHVLPVDVKDIEDTVSCDQFRDISDHSAYRREVQWMRDQRSLLLRPTKQDVFSDESIVVIGGCEDGSNKDMQCFSFPQKKWFKLASLPSDVGFDFAVCSSGMDIFVSGGTNNKNAFLRYDGENNRWDKMPAMPCRRQRHCMAVVRNTLYVLGGYDTPQSSPYQNIDAFNLITMQWVTTGKKLFLANPVRSASCAVLRRTIYIVGGLDSKGALVNRVQYVNVVDCYSGEEFQILPIEPNFQYKAVVVDDKLYVVSKNGDVLDFCPKANHRPLIVGKLSHFPRKDYGLCEFENNILVLGGVVSFQPRSDMIQFHIKNALTISMQEVMPSPRRQFGVCKTTVIRRHLSNVDD
ncbi:kelch-like protein 3 [Mizuhopecten yessoensis]|uniref:kelch-like protein 3 n=1 Tax=Mizuhopecten yessoensis TaxID=6573 RepID=UPI000B45CADA|nr:kelch-like protein 3 [Mizuhopecten yessoensis]